jgi:Raf kinase inhibitor-like YbhB/YbcL family protein
MTLRSSAFEPGQPIPEKYTCQGANVSPPLSWSQAPELTESFVLVVADPDAPDPAAPKMIWHHWLVYGIDGDARQLEEGAKLSKENQLGWNDFKHRRYEGPCPPTGRHRYFFKLYALDFFMRDLLDADRSTIEEKMEGRILAKAELMGTYEKRADAKSP